MAERSSLPLGLVTGALITAVAIGATAIFTGSASVAAQPGGGPVRQITVIGNGEAFAIPDSAIVTIGVETNGATTAEALASNNAQAATLLETLQNLGVAERDIQTSGFNIYPTYSQDGSQITGYNVGNTVTVKVRDLAGAGNLLDSVVQAGANRLYGIAFQVADPSAPQAEARLDAVADAQARAEALATSLGLSVGEVLSINENIGATPISPAAMMSERAQGGSGVPIQAGEQVFSAQVQVTFVLR